MSIRSVQQVLPPPPPHMVGDGFRVHNFFPSGYNMDLLRMSPFFMMDYGSRISFSPTDKPRGVGVHPHRGFETVTIAYKGRVAHHDSAGNSGVIAEGDVQWMTAGSGILHKEYHEQEFSRTGGDFHMVQLWVNLPAAHKMTPPKYQPLENAHMGRVMLEDGHSFVELIAGEYQGVRGPASTFTPMHLSNLRLHKGARLDMQFPEAWNTGLLVAEGSIRVNDAEAPQDHFVLLRNDGESFTVEALEDCIVLVLSGEPIRENLVPYGPFLMNTKAEILQAFEDLHAGKFGHLEE